MNLSAYLPQDRRRALARGKNLPDRTTGTALFADISGFTALTERLHHTLGSRRGMEVLTGQINAVYTALIAEIERHGGSVISFAGDAVMCWFDAAQAVKHDALRTTAVCAVNCGLAMQAAMNQFPELGLKIAIASGPTRRFVVGDPQIHYLDTLAGTTVARTATGERLAHKGELLLDKATVELIGSTLTIAKWRADQATGESFAVITALAGPVPLPSLLETPDLEPAQLQSWLHQPVYARQMAGRGAFLTEFRPCVALFIRFNGIDYDSNAAQNQLDTFIHQAQAIAARYEGYLIDLTIGDKGSYAYINFGALSIHEDDARRAVKTALSLREVTQKLSFLAPLQMGITSGVMRTGAYGGATRLAYGALGDEVNLAARLMSQAAPGEILVSKRIYSATAADFAFVAYPAVQFKGKKEPVPIFAVTDQKKRHAIRLQEPTYALPMIGRQAELETISAKMDLALQGNAQVIAIVAEAGLGKSRLMAEVIRIARQKGFSGYGGACQSDAIRTPYHVWKTIWQALFDVDPEMPLAELMRHLTGKIKERAPRRVNVIPLLNAVLDTHLPENDFTKLLEPKIRQSALHALLEDYLKATARNEPLLIVIEDMHWLDALSHNLLEQLAKATVKLPICFALAYRPPQLARLAAPRLESLPQFTRIELQSLTPDEAEQVVRAKLAQLYPARAEVLPARLVATLMARSQGNPFYLEELLNYVHDCNLDPANLDQIELPDSLHALILSRIDQLHEAEKTALRAASVIGRLFFAKWLTGYCPELGPLPQVKESLEQLHRLDITPLESLEPELAYLFKHIITHEVTYESLPFATRARLHEQLALYLENTYPESLPLEALAFHYGRSANQTKQIEYLRKAGEAAQKNFAHDAALDFYGALLPLLTEAKEKLKILLQRGQVYELLGNWAKAESDYRAALEMDQPDAALKADAQFALGKLSSLRGNYALALAWLEQARETRMRLGDRKGLARALIEIGAVLRYQGQHAKARDQLNAGLALAQEAGDKLSAAQALNNLGNVAWSQGAYAEARALHEESLSLRHEMGDKYGVANSFSNLGIVATDQGDYAAARALSEESLSLRREMGDKKGIALSLANLGLVARNQGDYAAARALQEESLSLRREMGDKQGIAAALNNLGVVAADQGDYAAARALYAESIALCKEMGEKYAIAYAWLGFGLVALAENQPEAREHILASLRLRVEVGARLPQTSSLVGAAGLALQAGDAVGAARLLGAVEAALNALNAALESQVKRFHAHLLAGVKAQLGEAAFHSAWEAGRQWSLAEAVAYALGENP